MRITVCCSDTKTAPWMEASAIRVAKYATTWSDSPTLEFQAVTRG